MEFRHKPGPMKQQNKPHKTGKHQTKSTLTRKGKLVRGPASQRSSAALGRQERRNRANQIRKSKREQVVLEKRARGLSGSPPHLLLLVPMARDIRLEEVRALLRLVATDPPSATNTFYCSRVKQRFTLCSCPYGDMYTLLDLARVSDSVLFLFSVEEPISEWAEQVVSLLMAQGLPTPLHAVVGLQGVPTKDRAQTRVAVSSVVSRLLPVDTRLFGLDTETEAFGLLRAVSEQKRRSLGYRDNRPHLYCEETRYDVTSRTLSISGYLRGKPLSPNQLVHVPGAGDFQIGLIETQPDPCPFGGSGHGGMEVGEHKVRLEPDPDLQESLLTEAEVDPMEGEQTWPSKAELKSVLKPGKSYQSSWIPEVTEGDESESDTEEQAAARDSESEAHGSVGSESDSESGLTESGTMDTADYDKMCDPREEREQLQRIRAQREDARFPDERDTPLDLSARVRFGKYRGLQSFRTSPWDPAENLPPNYARIFSFFNFRATQKRVLRHEYQDGDVTGLYITVHLKDFPPNLVPLLPSKSLVLFGLLQFEQKMSLIHFTVKRVTPCKEVIKSKDPLLIYAGCRRFTANPIYSQHTLGDKHKFELFFRSGGMYVASVYAPIAFTPCPVLMFTPPSPSGPPQLVACGSVLTAGPGRIICKRIILSGHPYKIHRRSAVVRYMLFSREDILWFKPVQLRTKCGRVGSIKEPLGTHGHMKCTFDKQLKAQDTILMSLYKRVFPKWTYSPYIYQPDRDVTHGAPTMETDREK